MTPTEIRAAIAALELKTAPLLGEIARLEDMSVGATAAVFAWVITAGIAWLVWRLL